jgi:hypothetical protein
MFAMRMRKRKEYTNSKHQSTYIFVDAAQSSKVLAFFIPQTIRRPRF